MAKTLGNIDLGGLGELRNANFQNLAVAPSTNLRAGRFYFSTADSTFYVYNGTSWVDALSQGNYTFENGVQLDTLNRHVSIKLATSSYAGNITFTADSNGLAANAPTASTSTAGLIEIATDSEASTGTSETLAVNPKQLATKIGLTNLSIDSGSANYLSYDNTNGKFSAKVDTTVTASSTNLVTSGAVENAISTALVGGIIYKGTWAITTSTTDFSGITLPVKKGYMYYVTGTGPAIVGSIEWNPGDYLLVNADVASGGSLSGKVEKIDNTESSDIVKTSATQTLTNKTIDADDNTILDLTTSNLKSGVLQTTVRDTSSASDTALVSEKAIATALATKTGKLVVTNPALTVSSGQCTWSITNSLGTDEVVCALYEVSSNEAVYPDWTVTSSTVTVKMNASADISAGVYRAVIIG